MYYQCPADIPLILHDNSRPGATKRLRHSGLGTNLSINDNHNEEKNSLGPRYPSETILDGTIKAEDPVFKFKQLSSLSVSMNELAISALVINCPASLSVSIAGVENPDR